ncbi:MAG: hypothetical protein K9J37_21010 [Saprospiraceae bacterium]|nr:hypothetical protein [Saprospiraceae bacterium]MCF8252401.1 hypothetical protein [Saprospiraceae bacterium]MCF8282271.1 hypothetical protein [Bacteroidales bacterium]MCF8313975.1 hypothetical protein [Saprospiraceae bacterium]MCF8442731.1 hypothetical protein [Saprospiraceae bacterium]
MPTFHVFLSEDLSKEAFIHWTDHLGKRHRKKGGINRFHTLQERRAAADEHIASIIASYIPPSPIGEKMLAWVEERKSCWRKKSWQTFKSKVDVFLGWARGRAVTNELMRNYFGHLLKNKHNTTFNANLNVFKRIFIGIGMPD